LKHVSNFQGEKIAIHCGDEVAYDHAHDLDRQAAIRAIDHSIAIELK
jgi:hypothetical protein